MRITFLGAAKTVTGSCFLVETDKTKFLVDCGMFQGNLKESAMNEEPFPFNPADLDFILLTHAHIDHSGRLPKIFLDGFNKEIIATKATTELCGIMLPDSGHIQEIESEWLNRKRERAGKSPVKPLYTFRDAMEVRRLFKPVKYGDILEPASDIRVRFNDAGHILGSSIIEVWVKEEGRETKAVFTGDLGSKNMPILRDPAIIDEADFLVIESTYGNRLHNETTDKTERFLDIICKTLDRGGNVIIPSFAVGRTQEIIYELNRHYEKFDPRLCKLYKTPVYIDSPLAISATEVFRNNLDCYDEEARSYIENGDNPLDFPGLRFTRTPEESKMLNEMKENAIIISASGMCEAGRIKHHLKHNLWRKESSVVFVGYQAEGTLGRRLLDGARRVKIFGEDITVNASIEMIDGFSGHADRDGLLGWIGGFHSKPEKIFIVHGEEESMSGFSRLITENFGIKPIIPNKNDTFTIGAELSDRREGRKAIPVAQYAFKRLEVVDYLEKIKEELDEMADIIKSDLKKEMPDENVDKLKEKLGLIENSILEVLK